MKRDFFGSRLASLVGALLIAAGATLAGWAIYNLPAPGSASPQESVQVSPLASPLGPAAVPTQAAPAVAVTNQGPARAAGSEVTESAELAEPLVIAVGAQLPSELSAALAALDERYEAVRVVPLGDSTVAPTVSLDWNGEGVLFYRQVFAAATRFDTVDIDASREEIQALWRAPGDRFGRVVVLANTLAALEQVLGAPGDHVLTLEGEDARENLIAAAYAPTPTLALLPFEQLHPRLATLKIDGRTPVENDARFAAHSYPLTAVVYIHGHGADGRLSREQSEILQALPKTNRDPARFTVVAATGVTAMTRNMAAEMERRGYAWPAEDVGPELAAADITVISNEVPFVEGCEPNTAPDNLVFCSKPEYMETLLAVGVTIVGLTGNHQNDFGRQAMLDSLEVYAAHGIPVYGGGRNRAEATAPLFIEHNGNRLAFVGVNSFGPPSAWATEQGPGSAPYDLAILSATIRGIKTDDLADVVFAEFQYQESYDVEPLWDQRREFGAVVRAGADVVTGVQSHVPQAVEFLNPAWPPEAGYADDRLILHGLGNLFFDQMWTEPTRENLIAKHTIYDGRHISTQLLTTLLHDFGQPRWAEPERRAAILERVFAASRLE